MKCCRKLDSDQSSRSSLEDDFEAGDDSRSKESSRTSRDGDTIRGDKSQGNGF